MSEVLTGLGGGARGYGGGDGGSVRDMVGGKVTANRDQRIWLSSRVRNLRDRLRL